MKFVNEIHYEYDKSQPFSLLYARTSYDKESIFERTNFAYYVFEYVLEGSGTVIIDNTTGFTTGAGDIYILPKYHDHTFYASPGDGWHKTFFIADGAVIENLLHAYKLDGIFLYKDCNLKEAFSKMREIFLSVDPKLNFKAAILFHEIIQTLYESVSADMPCYSPDVLKIKEILDENINRKIDLNKVCAMLKKSKTHIISKFREETGTTPYDYLLNRKIELAEKLLCSTSFSVKEIAERLKFADQYYFSGIFKKKTGFSPRNYRIGPVEKT